MSDNTSRRNHPILTLEEVAELMKVPEAAVRSLVKKEHLPAFIVGGQWRVLRDDVFDWIEQQLGRAP